MRRRRPQKQTSKLQPGGELLGGSEGFLVARTPINESGGSITRDGKPSARRDTREQR